jgi:hypothetical protein
VSEATRKLRILAARLRQDAAARMTDATADLRALDEIDELLVQDEPTNPGSPTSKSQQMGAVHGMADRVGDILEKGRVPGTDKRR